MLRFTPDQEQAVIRARAAFNASQVAMAAQHALIGNASPVPIGSSKLNASPEPHELQAAPVSAVPRSRPRSRRAARRRRRPDCQGAGLAIGAGSRADSRRGHA